MTVQELLCELRRLLEKGATEETGLGWHKRLRMARRLIDRAEAETVTPSLMEAAERMVAAVDEQHASKEPPLKYTVPWGAVADLRAALAASSGVARISAESSEQPTEREPKRAGQMSAEMSEMSAMSQPTEKDGRG